MLTGPLEVLRTLEMGQTQNRRSRAFYNTLNVAKIFFDTAFPLLYTTPTDGTTFFQTYINAGSDTDPSWTPGKLDIFYMPVRLMDEAMMGRQLGIAY